MGRMFRIIHHAVRSLQATPAHTLGVSLLMAIGIGTSMAAFSVVNGFLWPHIPFPQPDRLVVPVSGRVTDTAPRSNVSYADYRDWSAMGDVFERVAIHGSSDTDLTGGGEPESIEVSRVTTEYFATLGLQPSLGRTLRLSDGLPGAPQVVVVSHALWQRRFGGARDVIGRTVHLSGLPAEIVGVMPPQATFQSATLAWVPAQEDPASPDNVRRDNLVWGAIARLKAGVSIEQARARVKALAARLEGDQPAVRRGWTNDVVEFARMGVTESARQATLVLFGAVVATLLVACVNVAGLLLARATTRQREIAVRMAVGASRGDLVGHLLAEASLVALSGGSLGVLLAHAILRIVPSLVPGGVLPPGGLDLGLDTRVLAFALGVSCVSALLSGFVPAWMATSTAVERSLRSGVGALVQRRTHRMRSLLVAVEVAVSCVLLVGAGLLVRSFVRLLAADPGAQTLHVLTAGLRLPRGRYQPGAPVADFYARALDRLRATPGVASAAAVSLVPIGGPGLQLGRAFLLEGTPVPPLGPEFSAEWSVVTPGYFKTLAIPLVGGRSFDDRDTATSTPVAIVSEALAHTMFPGRDPIGQRIRSWRDENVLRQIVGVARDVRYFGATQAWSPLVYVPHRQSAWRGMRLVIRTAGDPLAFAGSLRRAIAALDPDLPLNVIETADRYRLASMAGPRLAASLMGAFGMVALMLAAVGVFGLMSYSVALRTREFGLRLALGARPADLLSLVLRRAVALTAIGSAAGLAGALAGRRLVTNLLFDTPATDPLTFVAMPALLSATAVLASVAPARRALRVDPTTALRAE